MRAKESSERGKLGREERAVTDSVSLCAMCVYIGYTKPLSGCSVTGLYLRSHRDQRNRCLLIIHIVVYGVLTETY